MSFLSRAALGLLAGVVLAGCGSAAPVSVAVPDVVGQALDAAKSFLVASGFAAYPQDLLRDRNPLLDSDWTVCRQSPGPVVAVAGSTVDLGVVKKAEACPDAPRAAAPSSAARTRAATASPKPQPARATSGNASSTRAAVGAVRSGMFCDPPATGTSDRGTAMVCAPAADGRNRWRRA